MRNNMQMIMTYFQGSAANVNIYQYQGLVMSTFVFGVICIFILSIDDTN